MRNIHLIDNQIYITSDEKPKRGDWAVYRNRQVYKCVEDIVGDEFKKIILSTDKWLIKFGVCAIDAEFVDWFFDNPNCEYVEITHKKIMVGWEPDYSYEDIGIDGSKEVYQDFYKISIPKEEHKQSYEYVGECKGNNNGCFLDSCGHDCGCFVRKPKQETLEEDAINYANYNVQIHNAIKEAVKFGANWQAERMYSQEEMLLAFETGRMFQLTAENNFNELIEQLKNKQI